MQPTNPDDSPTQPIDDIWTQPRPDTVDSAAPPAGSAARRGLRLVGVAGAVLALVAAGAFGALLAGGGGGGSAALTGAGSSTGDSSTGDGSGDGGTGDNGTAGDRRKGLGHGMLGHGRGGPGKIGGGMIGGGMLGGGMIGGPFGRGLHGSFVVEDPDGGYRTVLTQRGTATAVSDSSITVKSDDGFVATYRLTDESVVMTGPEGTDSITEGADVAVTALETGSSARAVHVVDLSQVRERFEHHLDGPGAPDEDDDDGDGTPTPGSTATSGASV